MGDRKRAADQTDLCVGEMELLAHQGASGQRRTVQIIDGGGSTKTASTNQRKRAGRVVRLTGLMVATSPVVASLAFALGKYSITRASA
jgi:hypothetical protein